MTVRGCGTTPIRLRARGGLHKRKGEAAIAASPAYQSQLDYFAGAAASGLAASFLLCFLL